MGLSTISDTLTFEHVIGNSPRPAYCTLDINALEGSLDPDVVADGAYAAWTGSWLGVQSSDVALVAVHYRWQTSGGSSEFVSVGHDNGEVAATAATANTALLVRKLTAAGGRSGTGRMYVPGPPENKLDMNGVLDGTYAGECQTASADFLDGLAAIDASVVPVVHSAADGGSSNSVILSMPVMTVAATQRRRLRK